MSVTMKSGKHILLILVALALGGMATYMSYRLIQNEVNARIGNSEEKKVGVVVAATDLDAGVTLDTGMLAIREIPEAYITSDSVMPGAVGQIDSGRLLRPVKSGEQLQLSGVSRLADQAFSSSLQAGSRALTFSVDDVNSMSGLLAPEDHIDLLLVYRRGEQDFSIPLLQNIRVLATGRNQGRLTTEATPSSTDQQYSNITLELTPQEARKLTLAQATGARITAVLRHPKDQALITHRSATFNDLVVNDRMPAGRSAARSSYGIPIYVGGMGGNLKPSVTQVGQTRSTASAALEQLGALMQRSRSLAPPHDNLPHLDKN